MDQTYRGVQEHNIYDSSYTVFTRPSQQDTLRGETNISTHQFTSTFRKNPNNM